MNWIWVLLVVIVIVLDIATSNVIFSWLSIGFAAAFIASGFLDFQYQAIIAFVLGIIFILIGNNITKKYIRKNINNEPILVDKYIGQLYVADKDIAHDTQHKVNGIYWMLINEGPVIHEGEHFRVVEIRENKLVIIKEEN